MLLLVLLSTKDAVASPWSAGKSADDKTGDEGVVARADGVDGRMGEVELDTLVIKNVRIKQCERRTRDSRKSEGRQMDQGTSSVRQHSSSPRGVEGIREKRGTKDLKERQDVDRTARERNNGYGCRKIQGGK